MSRTLILGFAVSACLTLVCLAQPPPDPPLPENPGEGEPEIPGGAQDPQPKPIAIFPAPTPSRCCCDSEAFLQSGWWWQIVDCPMPWKDADNYCRTRMKIPNKHVGGGRLASIRSQSESDLVKYILDLHYGGTKFGHWLGLERRAGLDGQMCTFDDQWRWTDGAATQWLPWANLQPNCRWPPSENCGHLTDHYRMNDAECGIPLRFICRQANTPAFDPDTALPEGEGEGSEDGPGKRSIEEIVVVVYEISYNVTESVNMTTVEMEANMTTEMPFNMTEIMTTNATVEEMTTTESATTTEQPATITTTRYYGRRRRQAVVEEAMSTEFATTPEFALFNVTETAVFNVSEPSNITFTTEFATTTEFSVFNVTAVFNVTEPSNFTMTTEVFETTTEEHDRKRRNAQNDDELIDTGLELEGQ